MAKDYPSVVYGGQQQYEEALSAANNDITEYTESVLRHAGDSPSSYNRRGERITSISLGEAFRTNIGSSPRGLKRIDFTGLPVNSPEALAKLFSVYRSPRYEHFHYVFLSSDNRILAHNAITAGIINATPSFPVNNPNRGLYLIRRQIARLDAAQLLVLHNHPSSDVTPSAADIDTTQILRNELPQLKYHVIIDHDRFSYLIPSQDGLIECCENVPLDPHDHISSINLLNHISRPSDAAWLMHETLHGSNSSSLIALDSKMCIAAWRPCNEYVPGKGHHFVQQMRAAYSIYASTSEDDWEKAIFAENTHIVQNPSGRGCHLKDAILINKDGSYRSAVEYGRLPCDHSFHNQFVVNNTLAKTKTGFEW